ncbi:MAG: rhomboid family intramembrane serine protease, partial [Sciscionella sp.]
RSVAQLAVATILLFYWGTTLLGILPGNPLISWQAHLFGALAGVLAAWLTAKASGPRQSKTTTPKLPGNLAA